MFVILYNELNVSKYKPIKHAYGLKKILTLSTFLPIKIEKKNIHLIQFAIKILKMICLKKLAKEVHNSACKVKPYFYLGYNCTIFAYGQTGAGKTYTMMGINP